MAALKKISCRTRSKELKQYWAPGDDIYLSVPPGGLEIVKNRCISKFVFFTCVWICLCMLEKWSVWDDAHVNAWKTTTSVARYSKPARLNEQIKAMPAPVVKELERREKELKNNLHVWLSKQR